MAADVEQEAVVAGGAADAADQRRVLFSTVTLRPALPVVGGGCSRLMPCRVIDASTPVKMMSGTAASQIALGSTSLRRNDQAAITAAARVANMKSAIFSLGSAARM